MRKNIPFPAMDARYYVTYTFRITRRQHQACTQHNLKCIISCCRVSCQVLYAKVIGVISSEGCLVKKLEGKNRF